MIGAVGAALGDMTAKLRRCVWGGVWQGQLPGCLVGQDPGGHDGQAVHVGSRMTGDAHSDKGA